MSRIARRYDFVVHRSSLIASAVIAGGGPAGLSAAIALRQLGVEVTVIDSSRPPIDKACGEGLLPESLEALQRLVIAVADHGFRFKGIKFRDAHATVQADFPNGRGVGLRRTVLHKLLTERAVKVGVDLQWGVQFHPALAKGADLLVGADGGHSKVRKQAGLDEGCLTANRFGFTQHFRIRPWSEYVEVYWGCQSQLYVTPLGEEEVSVAVVSRQRDFRLTQAWQEFPDVESRLRLAERLTTERGGMSTMRRLPRVFQNRVVLVGDASGSIDVITGEGLGLGFQQAIALADAISKNDLDSYARAHSTIMRRPRLMANLLLMLAAHPTLRRYTFALLAAQPRAFSSLLALHVGQLKSMFA